MKRIYGGKLPLFWITLSIAVLLIVQPALGQTPGGPQHPRHESFAGHVVGGAQVLVKLRAHAQSGRVAQEADAHRDEPVGGVGVRLLHSRSHDTPTLIARLARHPDVEYVEPNFLVHAGQIVPADPSFASLWGLQNMGQTIGGTAGIPGADIGASLAWGTSTGARANVVAVVDTGIDYTHPDLAGNIWSAPASFMVTIGGQVITCPAGTHGFNAITKTCDPRDDNNHGTHVSGTIGAIGNNTVGVVGVNWAASIMGLKFLDATGNGYISDAINAIDFAVQAKARLGVGANVRVLSNSWTGGGFSQALLDEINRANASDMLFVAAAGNSASNNDTSPTYPASYTAPNVVSVAATDNRDYLALFSNYGRNSVHLGAPGVNVLSTVRGGGYGYGSGTSMAAPHVSGAAALTLSVCNLTTAGLKNALLSNVDVVLLGWTITGGRLSADRALNGCAAPSPPAAPGSLTATATTSSRINLAWSDNSADEDGFAIERCQGSGCTNFAQIATVGAGATSFANTGLAATTSYSYRVSAYNAAGNSYSNTASATTPPLAPSCSYSISPAGITFSASGGSGTVSVTTGTGCSWTAVSYASWISVKSSSGTGNGSVGYSVSRNRGAIRTGTLTVAGKTFTVTQAGTGKKQ